MMLERDFGSAEMVRTFVGDAAPRLALCSNDALPSEHPDH
jgi:hypothetical protein